MLNQREKMLEVKKLIEQMQKMGKAFQQSKIELLNNIRTRLRDGYCRLFLRSNSWCRKKKNDFALLFMSHATSCQDIEILNGLEIFGLLSVIIP